MIISVKVHANSSRQELIKINEKEFEVYLKSPAEKNKANIELIKLLGKYFIVSSGNIKIKKGLISKNKIVEIKL